jgi:hypothetical protein
MSYVGAAAEPLEHLSRCLTRVAEDAGVHRARISAMLQEAGEFASAPDTLAEIEQWGLTSAADVASAAALAAADASSCPPSGPVQTGLRASMGLVDDVFLDVFLVNDLSRLLVGRDINTGTPVGPGGRALSAVGLIPFGKVAKLGKLVRVADDASHAARITATPLRDEVAVAVAGVPPVKQEVIAETFQRRGGFTSDHVLNDDEALDVGVEFLGGGYRELGRPGSGVFRSQDGLRQFRIDETSLAGTHRPWQPHVHLQIFPHPTARREIVNNHIPLRE